MDDKGGVESETDDSTLCYSRASSEPCAKASVVYVMRPWPWLLSIHGTWHTWMREQQ